MMKSFFFPVLATVLVLLTSQSMVGLVDAQIISSESVDYRLGFIIAAALAIVFFVMTVLMAVYINKTISRQKKIERRQLELTAESNRRVQTPFHSSAASAVYYFLPLLPIINLSSSLIAFLFST
eukprot:m.82368 g.82368  ORF g.82368 m.82368 type:complete len:124 (-) comp12084_c0_seq2:23-394(-)